MTRAAIGGTDDPRKTHFRPCILECVLLVGTKGSADKAAWPSAHEKAAPAGPKTWPQPNQHSCNASHLHLLTERRPDRVESGRCYYAVTVGVGPKQPC